jgi:hypothetical protein
MSGPPNPITPNFTPGVGKLVTTRFDFEKHIDGASFRHNATMIDLSPSLTVNAVTYTDVQDALTAIIAGLSPPPVYATATVPGLVQLSTAGDVQGVYNAMRVTALRGYPITTSPPTTNNVLSWNGVAWTPTPLSFGLIPGGTPSQVLISNASSVPTWTTISGDATVSSGGAFNVAQAQSGALIFGENGAITASSGSLTGGAYSISSNGTNTFVNAPAGGLIELNVNNVAQVAVGVQTITSSNTAALYFNPHSGTFTPNNTNWTLSIDSNNNTYLTGSEFIIFSTNNLDAAYPEGIGASLTAGFFNVAGNFSLGNVSSTTTGGVGSSQYGLFQLAQVYAPPISPPISGEGCFVYNNGTGLTYCGPSNSTSMGVPAPFQQIAGNWQGTSSALNSQACQVLQYIGATQTTNNVPTTAITIPVPSGHVVGVWVRAVCFHDQVSTQGATFEWVFQGQNIGGTVFLPSGVTGNGSHQTYDSSLSTCTLEVGATGADLFVFAVGINGTTLNWTAKAEVILL